MSSTLYRTQITDRLAYDPNLSTGGTHYASSAVPMPIDFSDATLHVVTVVDIPGGALGPNGYLEILMGGAYSTTASPRTVKLQAAGTGFGVSAGTETLPTKDLGFQASVVIQNLNVETVQGGVMSLVFGQTTPPATPSGPYLVAIPGTADTTGDWGVQVILSTDGAVSLASVTYLRTQVQYIP